MVFTVCTFLGAGSEIVKGTVGGLFIFLDANVSLFYYFDVFGIQKKIKQIE